MYYSPAEATREIKNRLRSGGKIIFTAHAEEQMQLFDRCIDGQEVTAAIRSGAVRKAGEEINGEYRYRIESNLNGGIAVIVEIPDGNLFVIVITTFRQIKKKLKKVRR